MGVVVKSRFARKSNVPVKAPESAPRRFLPDPHHPTQKALHYTQMCVSASPLQVYLAI